MKFTCSSIAEVLTSTKAKSETPVTTIPSSSPDNVDKDLSQALDSQQDTAMIASGASDNTSPKESESNAIDDITSPRRGRVSKRVQSQAITSEKQNERRAKRSSAEYCLLAGVLSSTSQNPIYKKLLEVDLSWDKLPIMKTGAQQSQALLPPQTADRPQCDSTAPLHYQKEFSATSSLITFIHNMSRANSGPIDALEQFLVHVSLHILDVFGSENDDTISSCVIECE